MVGPFLVERDGGAAHGGADEQAGGWVDDYGDHDGADGRDGSVAPHPSTARGYCPTHTVVRSRNQDCGCTRPCTLGESARGLRSLTTNSHGASWVTCARALR